jgi:NAD(P)H-hydrate epimerase
MADSNEGNDADAIIKADQTWTFQCPKQSFLIPKWGVFPGEWEVLDIGLHSEFPELKKARWSMITEREVRSRLKPRGKFSHKGTFGHATIVAGSYGMMGSAALAVNAALRSGCGLVTAHVPQCGVDIIQTLAPEAMVQANSGELYLRPDTAELRGSWGLGPGIGQDEETAKALKQWLEKASSVVIDADALNLISQDSDLAGLIPKGSILTPHPKELTRLTGKEGNRLEQIEHACQLAARIDGVVVLKGAFTAICTADGKVWFNATGNTALSKGGSGDVLTGLLTGLLAQGYSSEEAAKIGVYIHGRAAEALVRTKPAEACTAMEVIDYLWME